MFKGISGPVLLIIGHKSRLWLVVIIGLAAILGTLGVRIKTSEPHAYMPDQKTCIHKQEYG